MCIRDRFLTLLVTVAYAEQTSSKLTLIKNYLYSMISQERLNGLGVLSMENIIARSIDIREITYAFAPHNEVRSGKFQIKETKLKLFEFHTTVLFLGLSLNPAAKDNFRLHVCIFFPCSMCTRTVFFTSN